MSKITKFEALAELTTGALKEVLESGEYTYEFLSDVTAYTEDIQMLIKNAEQMNSERKKTLEQRDLRDLLEYIVNTPEEVDILDPDCAGKINHKEVKTIRRLTEKSAIIRYGRVSVKIFRGRNLLDNQTIYCMDGPVRVYAEDEDIHSYRMMEESEISEVCNGMRWTKAE